MGCRGYPFPGGSPKACLDPCGFLHPKKKHRFAQFCLKTIFGVVFTGLTWRRLGFAKADAGLCGAVQSGPFFTKPSLG